jgi:hypothetical protein
MHRESALSSLHARGSLTALAGGMILGFATPWPANVWLTRKGIKEAM